MSQHLKPALTRQEFFFLLEAPALTQGLALYLPPSKIHKMYLAALEYIPEIMERANGIRNTNHPNMYDRFNPLRGIDSLSTKSRILTIAHNIYMEELQANLDFIREL